MPEDPDPYRSPDRISFPDDEAAYPWLSTLLDAYFVADEGIAEAIRREERQGRRLACAKGCSSCCRTHATIPVYPLELMGLSWYATEKLEGPARDVLKERLASHRDLDACPFLIEGACAVHAVRPLACRHFNVFGAGCAEGEDAYYTRRQDVLTPIKKYKDQAFYIMLLFHGLKKKAERRQAIKSGAIHGWAKVMRECNWESLAERMDGHDRG